MLTAEPVANPQRLQYINSLYSLTDASSVKQDRRLMKVFEEIIGQASATPLLPLSNRDIENQIHANNLLDENGKVRELSASLLIRNSSAQNTSSNDSDHSISTEASEKGEDPWQEVEPELRSLCVEKINGENSTDGFYPYTRYFRDQRRLLLHKTVNGKTQEYASLCYKNIIFEFVLSDEGTVELQPKFSSVKNLNCYPSDLPNILAQVITGRTEEEKEFVLYSPGNKSILAIIKNGWHAASGYALPCIQSISSSTNSYIPQIMGNPVGKALIAYLASGALNYFGVPMEPSIILSFLASTQDIRNLADHCRSPNAEIGTIDDFAQAYLEKETQKAVPFFEFSYSESSLKSQKTFSPLIQDNQLKLSPAEQLTLIQGCSAVRMQELIRRNKVDLNPEDNEICRWQVIKGLHDNSAACQYDEEKNQLIIAFRGLIKDESLKYSENKDMSRYLTAVPHYPKNYGLNLDGKMHAGFLKKYRECQDSLYKHLESFFSNLDKSKLSDLELIFTGDSLGSALAQIAAADICKNVLPKVFEKGSIENRLRVVTFSSPCVGDKEASDQMELIIGRENLLRVYTNGDLAALAGSEQLLKSLPSALVESSRKLGAIDQLLSCMVFTPIGRSISQKPSDAIFSHYSTALEQGIGQILNKNYRNGFNSIVKKIMAPIEGADFNKDLLVKSLKLPINT